MEADVQLKKDTALATSPDTKEGKEYWDKLYRKAEEIFGSQNVTIPTLTRPWVVPGEIIIRETNDNAYIYKATLKVMLEEDYLKNSAVYNFKDERLKELNTYASQILREKIIPKLTQEVNTSKRYAALRQVYYSLILAQWFKQRFYGKGGLYSHLIDTKNLNGLTSKESWSKTTYFQQYQKSFKDGEYNFKLPVSTPFGQTIRSYFSGGVALGGCRPVSAFPPGQTAILEGGGSYLNTGASRERNIGRGVGGNDIPIGYDATNGKVTLEKLPIATGQSSQPSFTSPLPPASAPAATRGTLPENLLEAVRWIDSTDVVPGMEAVSVGPGTPRYLYLERKMQEAQSIPWEQFLVAKGVNVRVYEPKEEYNKSWRDDVAQWQGMEGKLKIEPTESARFEKNNFPDGSVDIITILSVLSDRSIPESVRKEIVLKAARALRQKGYLVIGWYDLVAGKKVSAEEEAETQSLLAWLQKETGYKLTPVTGGLETGQTAHRWVIYKINKPTPSVSGPAAASAPAAPGSAAGLQSRLQDTLRLIKEIAEEDSFKKSLEEYSAEKERLFGIYGEVAQIAKGIREIDSFDLVINPASGSDIKAGFSYGNNLVTIDRNNLFKVFLEFLAIGKKESLKEQLRGYLENKFYFGLHSSGRQVGFVEYAAELIAMGADLNSLEVISDQDIAGLHMTEVAFKVKGKQFTHTHFTYTFTGGAEDAKAVQSIKDVLVKKTNANVLLLSKAGSELSGKNEWLKSIDPLLPAGGMLVTDFSWSGVGLQDVTPQQKVANLGLSETRNYGYAHATQDLHFFEKKAGKDSRELAQTTSAPAAASTPTERASTALAKQMEREGKSREEILRETGYWRLGQDMQVSIDFSSLRLRPDALAVLRAKKASGQEAVLADIIEDGWEGVWLVPELTQTRVTIEPAPEGPVKYWGAMVYVAKDGALVIAFNKASAFNKDGMLSKGVGSRFIHEVSHALGHIKNYARGGNPANEEYMLTYAEYARVALQLRQLAKRNRLIFGEKGVVLESLVAAPIEDVIERWQADHHETVNPEAVEVAKSAATDAELVFAGSFRKDSVAADSRNYRLLQGEAVARMEQIRAAMTAQERQAEHPYNTLTRMLREERLLTKGQKPEDVLIYREHKPASAPAAQPEAKPGIEGPLLNDTMTKEEIYREVKRIITKNRPNAPDEVIYVVVKTARHFTSLLSEEDILM
ncbi:MAG: hypothetical protein NTW13_03025, partial [Candidatus Omnitrophica bacterium]|nr:hypothetical protein [Candidatus Omnitrophota bacterium]